MDRLKQFLLRNLTGFTSLFIVFVFLLIYFAPNIIITVPAGHVGVLWKRFDDGTVTNRFYREGNQFILPWNRMLIYDARILRVNEDYDIISSNGLAIGANITFRLRINRDLVGLLHKYLGPDYLQTVVIPKVGAVARAEAAKYSPVQLYSTNREEVEASILAVTREQIDQLTTTILETEELERERRGISPLKVSASDEPPTVIRLHDILFRSITLPALVRDAIERKEQQYHVNLEYDFRLDRERKESERKAIEAQGIQQFQRVVSDGITDAYLRWKGIDATLQLALSNNSKIVVIGSGKDGLPIILGPFDGASGLRGSSPPLLTGEAAQPADGPCATAKRERNRDNPGLGVARCRPQSAAGDCAERSLERHAERCAGRAATGTKGRAGRQHFGPCIHAGILRERRYRAVNCLSGTICEFGAVTG